MFKNSLEEIKHLVKKTGILRIIPDKIYLKILFRKLTGKKLNLKNPKTFNEKLQWLKLYDRNPLYTKLVDKYAVRDYIKKNLGEKYLIPLVGGPWNSVEEIDFSKLPNQFVLKCTHDSGSVIVCKDKSTLDISSVTKRLKKALEINYYFISREWPYKNVSPRIIAEKYMTDESGYDLKDYKIYNFNGIPKIIQVDFDRFTDHHKHNYYTTEWEYMDVQINCLSDPLTIIERPAKLKELLYLAGKLSEDLPHARTDFYSIGNELYFGEITFFHESGFAKFKPEEFGYQMGSWINLPNVRK